MDHDIIHMEEDVDDLISDIHQLIDEETQTPEPEEEAPAEGPAVPEPEPAPEAVPEPEPAHAAEELSRQQRWTDRQKVPKHVAKLQQNQEEAYAQWLKEQEEKGEEPPPVFEEELPKKKKKRKDAAEEPREEAEPVPVAVKEKKSRFALWFCLLLVVMTLAAAAMTVFVVPSQPQARSEHIHASGASAVLLAGTDETHGRTDMLMLMTFNTAKGKLSLVSIPRDTQVLTGDGLVKLGSVYGRAGGGSAGIAALEQAVGGCVGFVPDGTLVLHPEALTAFVEALGGASFGEQTLTGEEALALVSQCGEEPSADLTRVQTQRQFLAALIGQCRSAGAMLKAPRLLDALCEHAVTNMTTENLLWLARAAVTVDSTAAETVTLPGAFGDDGTYYLDEELVVQTVNAYCNPYIRAVGEGDLDIFSVDE